MYRVPKDLDLSKVKGQFTTQLCVGPQDLQFDFGDVHFAVQSEIRLFRNGSELVRWQAGEWPPKEFYEIFNVEAALAERVNRQEIAINLNNGTSIHLYDNSDQYESMQIEIKGDGRSWII